jgi:hypothetical protein
MRIRMTAVLTAFVLAATAQPAMAANPHSGGSTGQPTKSCGSATAPTMPHGFSTGGFANAGTVYAGIPGTPSATNGNAHAVSQYDVACFQISQHS